MLLRAVLHSQFYYKKTSIDLLSVVTLDATSKKDKPPSTLISFNNLELEKTMPKPKTYRMKVHNEKERVI